MKCPVKPGVRGWLLAGVVILAADLLDEATLSETFKDFSRTRGGRVITCAGWTLLTLHLFGVIPSELDPFVLAFAHAPGHRKVVVIRV